MEQPSTAQLDLLHETSFGAIRSYCQRNQISPKDIRTVIEVGEPQKIECRCKDEVLVTADIDDDTLTIKLNYKLAQT